MRRLLATSNCFKIKSRVPVVVTTLHPGVLMPEKILSSHAGQALTPGLRPLLEDAYEQIVQV